MELTEDDVIQILKILGESNFDEVHFEKDGLKLTVIREGKRTPPQEFELPSKQPTQLKSAEQSAATEVKGAAMPITTTHLKNTLAQTERIAIRGGNLITIKAPMLGTFFRSPKPGAAPFVDVGTFVKQNTTVCIIEVMKHFTPIKANILGGYIVNVLPQDGQMVEYGQELFLVKPAVNSGVGV